MKHVFHIETSNSVSISKPALHIKTGQNHFSFAITEYGSNILKKLSYYIDDEGISSYSLNSNINFLPELNGPFFRVNICYDFPDNMLIPADVNPQNEFEIRSILSPRGYVMRSDALPRWNVLNVYFVPEAIYHFFKKKYADALLYHGTTISLYHMDVRPEDSILKIDFRHHEFSVMAIKGGKLFISQLFEYSSPEDVIYYLLDICCRCSFTQNEVKLIISGLIEPQFALYRELYQYFVHISFSEADWITNRNEYPLHFFKTLNDLSKCG